MNGITLTSRIKEIPSLSIIESNGNARSVDCEKKPVFPRTIIYS
jgi:hypothetical protein